MCKGLVLESGIDWAGDERLLNLMNLCGEEDLVPEADYGVAAAGVGGKR